MKAYYRQILEDIANHEDFGKRNPVDIGNECGYPEEDVLEMIKIVQSEEEKKEPKVVVKIGKKIGVGHNLEVDTEIVLLPFYHGSNMFMELTDLTRELIGEEYDSEDSCREAIAEVIERCDEVRNEYIDFDSDKFVGIDPINKCCHRIFEMIDKIDDYVKINAMDIDLTQIRQIKKEVKKELKIYVETQIKKGEGFYTVEPWEEAAENITLEEMEDIRMGFFGGTKEVTTYMVGDNICDLPLRWDEEVKRFEEVLRLDCLSFVKSRYTGRINNFVEMINAKIEG